MGKNSLNHTRKPKIICTIGPSSRKPHILRALKERGVSYFRINLSHTDECALEGLINELKKFEVPIIIDTEGPQIRTGNPEEFFLKEGSSLRIYDKKIQCDEESLYFTPLRSIHNFNVGDLILVDFRSALLKVTDISKLDRDGFVTCRVMISGGIGSRKAVYIDNKPNLNVFSEKDFAAIKIAKKHNIIHFTLSLINNCNDVMLFKNLYPDAIVYSKIETKSALKNLKDILSLSHGILIDRGDLSKEISLEKIPLIQKYVLREARSQEKEAFVATNTLETMSYSLNPDKSEVNDIINTLLDGATGIALTKETAVGKYPVETVNMLSTLIAQLDYLDIDPSSTIKDIVTSVLTNNYFQDFNPPSLLTKPHGGSLVNRVEKNVPDTKELESFKKLLIDEKTLMDIEQIAIGAFSPLEGFMLENDFYSVLENYRLADGTIWPLPVILQVDHDTCQKFSPGDILSLVYKNDNTPYATLCIQEIYRIDKKTVARKWFSTDRLDHPGVDQFFNGGEYIIGGKINLIKKRESPHKLYELTPLQTRRIFSERGWSRIVGFHTRNVIHKSHEFIQLDAVKRVSADGLFVHPVIGKKKKGDYQANVILETYETMVNEFYPKEKVVLCAFATFSRYGGPREALFTGLVRKNFGCSHFIVGRDHTGVKEFYDSTASHRIFDQFDVNELGFIPIKYGKVFYSDLEKQYLHQLDTHNHPADKMLHISATQARKFFQKGTIPPTWFMRPEISISILSKLEKGEQIFVE